MRIIRYGYPVIILGWVIIALALQCRAAGGGDLTMDSLRKELRTAPNDSVYMERLTDICKLQRAINPDTLGRYARELWQMSLKTSMHRFQVQGSQMLFFHYDVVHPDSVPLFCRKAMGIGRQEGNDRLVMVTASWFSLQLQRQGAPVDTVLHYADQAIAYAKDSSDLIRQWEMKSRIYHRHGETLKALEAAKVSLLYIREGESIVFSIPAYENIRGMYVLLEQPDKADIYSQKIEKDWLRFPQKQALPAIAMNLAVYYHSTDRHERSLYYAQAADSFVKTMPALPYGDQISSMLATAYRSVGDLVKADSLLQLLRSDQFEAKAPRVRVEILYNHGMVKLGRTQAQSGIADCETALAAAEKLDSPMDVANCCDCLDQGYRMAGDYEKAYGYAQRNTAINDSLVNLTSIRKLAVMEGEVEAERREQAMRAEQEKQALIAAEEKKRATVFRNSLIGGMGLVSLVLFLVYRISRNRKHSNEVLTEKNGIIAQALEEKEALIKEIHHRVKNNLQTVSNLLELQTQFMADDSARAALSEGQTRLQSVALIHEQLYSHDNRTTINMLEFVNELMQHLEVGFGASQVEVSLTSKVEPIELDAEKAVPVGLILHEAINNAMKYAFKGKQDGKVHIDFFEEGERNLHLRVADNGVGIGEQALADSHRSYGLRLINIFTRELKGKVSFEGDGGTTVDLVFPRGEPARGRNSLYRARKGQSNEAAV